MLMLEDQDYCNMDMCMELDALGCPIPKHDTINLYTKERNTVYARFSLYEAQKWLRKKKGLHITIFSSSQQSWMFRITKPHQKLEDGVYGEDFYTYEDSLSAGINECIKLLKKYELESDNIISDTD